MFKRLLSALRKPRVLLGLALVAALVVVGLGLRLAAVSWLVTGIALVGIVLAVLIGALVHMLVVQEQQQILEGGISDAQQAADRRRLADQVSSAESVDAKVREAAAAVRDRTGTPYDLPWLLALGAQGSGRTALVAESGLDLPAEYARSRALGPTPSLDVVIAEQLVAIDVPGRMFAGVESDASEWRALLRALTSVRRRQPLNGVLFALPVNALLSGTTDVLTQTALQLRRRLNELNDALGIDVPVYLAITKCDLLDGFMETASALARIRPGREREALGWTNDSDSEAYDEAALRAFAAICDRLDLGLPELMRHDPDPERRRRIFGFSQELREVAAPLASFLRAAFKPSRFNEVPFLRGVYLTSARPQGQPLSHALRRLGQEWAQSAPRGGERSGWFARDLFAEIIAGDANLVIPQSRLAPLPQRLILGSAALLLVGLLATWGVSFWQNLGGTRRLVASAQPARLADMSLGQLDALRSTILAESERAASYVHPLGFHRLRRALDWAREIYVTKFDTRFDGPLGEALAAALRGDDAVATAITLHGDLAWFERHGLGGEPAPELDAYLDEPGPLFRPAYAAFVRWLPGDLWQLKRSQRRDLLVAAAPKLLDAGALERLTRQQKRYAAVLYPNGLPAAGADSGVPGIYTREAYEGLVAQLLEIVKSSGALPDERVALFVRDYVQRWDLAWRRYLTDVPTSSRLDAAVAKSPYLAVVDTLWRHAQTPLPREAPRPEWEVALVKLRSEPPPDSKEPALWPQYLGVLETVGAEVTDASGQSARAAELTRAIASKQPNAIDDALTAIRRIAPAGGDSGVAKLRSLLKLPVLDGLSAVGSSGARELDRRWRERIAKPYAGTLNESALAALYGPGGALAQFRAEELGLYYDDSGPKPILGRSLPFGPGFRDWMANAGKLQKALYSGRPSSVRLSGRPTRGLEGSGFVAKRRVLELVCPDGTQQLEYREGPPVPKVLRWDPSCQEVTLRVVLAGPDREEVRVDYDWRGPLALPSFLRAGVRSRSGPDVLEWELRAEGQRFRVPFAVPLGGELRELQHKQPPASTGS